MEGKGLADPALLCCSSACFNLIDLLDAPSWQPAAGPNLAVGPHKHALCEQTVAVQPSPFCRDEGALLVLLVSLPLGLGDGHKYIHLGIALLAQR